MNTDTTGRVKMWNYLQEIIRKEAFQKEIVDIRRKFNIPIDGYRSGYRKKNGLMPKRWSAKSEPFQSLWQKAEELGKKYKIFEDNFPVYILEYIFFNSVDELGSFCLPDLCLIYDFPQKIALRTIHETKHARTEAFPSIKDMQNTAFPLAIGISPYASFRDISSFLRKNYRQIKRIQERYAESDVNIGKVRKKSLAVAERNDFIYKNRNLPLKKIKEMVNERFNLTLGYEDVGKIKSTEIKKRKQL